MTLGGTELLIILIIVIFVFGIGKVPEVARSLGRSFREFREEAGEEMAGELLPEQEETAEITMADPQPASETTAAPPTLDEILDEILAQIEGQSDEQRLASSLQAVMEAHGYNANRLAEAIGIHPATIGRWLRVETTPQRDKLEAVLDAMPKLSPPYRQKLLALAGYATVQETPAPDNPIQLYLSCHGPDLAEEREQLGRYLRHRELGFIVEEGRPEWARNEITASIRHTDYLVLVQGLRWVPVRHQEYQAATEEREQVTGLFFQREGEPLAEKARQFRDEVVGPEQWHPFSEGRNLTRQVFTVLLDTLAREARTGRAVPLHTLTGLFLMTEMLTGQQADLPALLHHLAPDSTPPVERGDSPDPIEPALTEESAELSPETEPDIRPGSRAEPQMVRVPAGNFYMGSDRRTLERVGLEWQDWMDRETPLHRRRLPTYYIGRYPVTNAEFAYFVQEGGYGQRQFWTEAGWDWKGDRNQPHYWGDEKWNGPELPVVGVRWYEAVAYCRWLSRATGRLYRLPTEAEWEKAARYSDGRLWPWGNRWRADYCNTSEQGPSQTTPVGKYSPAGDSPYGAADMVGNVWEWCATQWLKEYPYNIEDEWTTGYLEGSSVRVLRGGSWFDDRYDARCAFRYWDFPSIWYYNYGFRVVSPI